jgi:transcriptional regulator with XRE-family HTH domain
VFEKSPNHDIVENIGQRIRQLRESCRMTQAQLQARSRVSKSYLSRIESGLFTPSLRTLEKIAEALGVGLSRCFVPATTSETILQDPFIRDLHPFVLRLDREQRLSIVKRLAAISIYVSIGNMKARRMAHGRSARRRN